ncbi:hypothetical protein GCM10025857_10960 [Alicyclobacillus contaminans]|nr:hypothetical protein GCM10025857_10960 [Alicyclobacillus contaminans]
MNPMLRPFCHGMGWSHPRALSKTEGPSLALTEACSADGAPTGEAKHLMVQVPTRR